MITAEEGLKLDKIMSKLQDTWETCVKDVCRYREREMGMRSSQIATLVLFLIREEVIKID
ncbi:hypothetical protein LCGC14_1455390 [marine sediment metagenome]|uniref:Uncharacterized protein n=1 Tax=marine sediment metagenome TaxID=412755 RepID=A0A0F9LX99_9ZZZZ